MAVKKTIFFLRIFAQNIDRGYIEAVLMGTHSLWFRAKIKNNVYPYEYQFYCIKWGLRDLNYIGELT